ncbi:MAG: hypothetical protein JXA21_26250 [Anaerolineae bacterium]|nr:hypothetical protein [Anaerolineae bacterium]
MRRMMFRFWKPLLVVCLFILGSSGAVLLAQTPTGAVGVYYDGPDDSIKEALQLASPYLVLVDQPDLAQVLVINGQTPRERSLDLTPQIRQGNVGMVLFCGAQFPKTTGDMGLLLGLSAFGLAQTAVPRSVQRSAENDTLQAAVAWESAPLLNARTTISNTNLLRPVITTDTGEPVVQRVRGRSNYPVFFVGTWFNHETNAEWCNWPYFRYLIYRLVAEAGGAPRILSFAQYPLSPVPQGITRLLILGGGVFSLLLAAVAFYQIQRHLYLHPVSFEYRYSTSDSKVATGDTKKGWQAVGFQRQLSGLLILIVVNLPLFGLVIGYQAHTLPTILIPWTQPLGFWEQVTAWLGIAWVLLDAGTGIAVVRYFSLQWPHRPQEAFRYFQFYVWWQLLSGALQLAVVAMLATLVFPQTALAHIAYYFVIHALIQFPGFLRVFQLFFRAIQRLDYEQSITVVLTVGNLVFQSLAVVLLRRWGAAQPFVGEVLGGILGLGLGMYLTEWLAFGAGWLLYRRLGYRLRVLWLPQFDTKVSLDVLSFGGRLVLGQVAAPLGIVVQALLFSTLLPNYPALQKNVTFSLILIYELLLNGLYNGLMPALVETLNFKYQTLLRYYVSQALHYGVWFSLFWLAGLAAVAERVLPELFGEALTVRWIFPILIWGALQWATWLPDRMLEAAGRPALTSWLALGEQVLRIGLGLLLVVRWQIVGLGLAYALARALRIVVGWSVTRRVVLAPRVYIWQTWIAPAGAAILVYHLAALVTSLWWRPTPLASLTLFVFVMVFLLPVYGFATALFGGWDNGSLVELKNAARLSGLGVILSGPLVLMVHLGARLSPLHGRFPVAIRKMAEEEAQALTLGQATPE